MTEAVLDPKYSYVKGGAWSWFTTVDAKRIGVLYGITALVFGIIGGTEAMLIRTQLATADSTLCCSRWRIWCSPLIPIDG